MTRQFFIIYPSELVRLGISSLLKTYYNYEIFQYESFDTINLSSFENDAERLILLDVKFVIDNVIPSKLKSKENTKFICISLEKNSTSYHSCHETIGINASRNDIIAHIDGFFKKSSITADAPENRVLSVRETEVLKYIAMGKSNKDIADILYISTHTIISHRKNLIEKLGIKSVSGLTVYAILNNIVDISEISNI